MEKSFEKLYKKIEDFQDKFSDLQEELSYIDDTVEQFIEKDNQFKGLKKKQRWELANKIVAKKYPSFHVCLKRIDKFSGVMQEALAERIEKLEELKDKLNDIESLQEEVEELKENL